MVKVKEGNKEEPEATKPQAEDESKSDCGCGCVSPIVREN